MVKMNSPLTSACPPPEDNRKYPLSMEAIISARVSLPGWKAVFRILIIGSSNAKYALELPLGVTW